MTGVLAGRNVIVTGAGRGLGRAFALDAAREGAAVVVNDVDGEAADAVVKEIAGFDGRAVASADSVSEWDGAARIVDRCRFAFGAVDGLVNNAGVATMAKPWEVDERSAAAMVQVNLLGTVFVGTHAIRAMRESSGGGAIVNVTSSGQLGISRLGVYGATKGSLASLTYSWALDLEDVGIRVNAFSPVADTAMSWMADIPKGVLPSPEHNAPAVTYLLSDLSSGLTGQVVQLRPPNILEVVAHPQMTGHTATVDSFTATAVAASFGPVLRKNAQPNGWGVGRS